MSGDDHNQGEGLLTLPCDDVDGPHNPHAYGALRPGVAPFVNDQVVIYDGAGEFEGVNVAIRKGPTWGWQVAIHGFKRITDAEVRAMLLAGKARIVHDGGEAHRPRRRRGTEVSGDNHNQADPRHHCGGRVVPETRRGIEHHICQSCNKCDQCDAAGRKTYGPHRGEVSR